MSLKTIAVQEASEFVFPTEFMLDGDVDPSGTSLLAETPPISFELLVAAIGQPHRMANTEAECAEMIGDGKMSTEWLFRSSIGRPVMLYDYKMTSLYSEDLPSPVDFRRDVVGCKWQVNALEVVDAESFVEWLVARVISFGIGSALKEAP